MFEVERDLILEYYELKAFKSTSRYQYKNFEYPESVNFVVAAIENMLYEYSDKTFLLSATEVFVLGIPFKHTKKVKL
jgi:hypothetical protein